MVPMLISPNVAQIKTNQFKKSRSKILNFSCIWGEQLTTDTQNAKIGNKEGKQGEIQNSILLFMSGFQ